ncbi:MAG TPA: ATP synthase F1 subunit epsilon [Patescibacteria group bacterium]|nr:ATP synthase F1 subunit epsilon [Patescibacteria group bacterium]
MPTIHFQIVTPERVLLDQEVSSISCPTALGEITVLPGHVPLVSTVAPGEIHVKTPSEDYYMYIAGGFVEIRPGNHVVILADAAEHYYEIDEQRAEEARQRAVKAMQEKTMSAEEYARVAASLHQSLTRLNIVRKHAHRRQRPITSEGVFGE